MKPTDFSKLVTGFLTDYLVRQKNVSANTIHVYRDTFKLLLEFCNRELQIPAERLTIDILTADVVKTFLNWLEDTRENSVSTRNLRLAAIRSFFRYTQYEAPELMLQCQRIMSVPAKKTSKPAVGHLTTDAMRLLLEQPDRNSARGRRDLALLSTLYDSAARVQELIDLSVRDYVSGENPTLVLTGKGSKTRRVPLMKNTATLLDAYIQEQKLSTAAAGTSPLFFNRQHGRLTKEGVAYIVRKYGEQARAASNEIPDRINCHMFRHSKAMHLLQAGVNLIYIRDFLGHSELSTTEVYARADTALKRKALENAYPDLVDSNLPDWNDNPDLMDWLSKL